MQVFTVTKDLDHLAGGAFVRAIRANLNADELWIVVPTALVGPARAAVAATPFVQVVDEREVLPLGLAEIAAWPVAGFPERAGWYYQQFLKLALAESSFARERYVVWDADTVPCRPIEMFEGDRLIFTRGYEFHQPYFETNTALIGVDRRQAAKFSVISQHMPVDRQLMREMLSGIAAASADGIWTTAIREAIARRNNFSLFSEYELFFDWLHAKHPDRLALRSVPWLRTGALLSESDLERARRIAWFIAFEAYERGQPLARSRRFHIWRSLLGHSMLDRLRPIERFG